MRGYSLFANHILTLVKENFNSVDSSVTSYVAWGTSDLSQSEGNAEGNID